MTAFLLFLILVSINWRLSNSNMEWLQLGSSINGESDSDQSGFAVSLSGDGSRVAIGAPMNAGGGNSRGHVRVYSYSTMTWTQIGADIDGEQNNEFFGYSVSLDNDGSRLAIGGPENSPPSKNRAGHVRVYEYNYVSDTWDLLGSEIDGTSIHSYLGWSVSLSGDGSRVAIGVPLYNTEAGQAIVYEYDSGGNTWGALGQSINGANSYDYFGASVSLSGDGNQVAVGGPQYNSGEGLVRIFDYNSGSDTWIQVGGDILGGASYMICGWSLSLSNNGTRLAVGCPGNTGAWNEHLGSSTGYIRIYDYSITTNSWDQIGSTITGSSGDHSGRSVCLSGDGSRLAIGEVGSRFNC